MKLNSLPEAPSQGWGDFFRRYYGRAVSQAAWVATVLAGILAALVVATQDVELMLGSW